MLKKTLMFLRDNKTFYAATVEDGKPRLRPFGLVIEHDSKLWFSTSNKKAVYRQLQASPFVEISTTSPSMEWLRLSGKAVFENNVEVKRQAFEVLPALSRIYQGPDDPAFEVFYLADAEVVFHSMETYGQEPVVHRL